MSSLKSDDHRTKKLSYLGNFEIKAGSVVVSDGNSKSGYIKADQFYYFNKDKIEYVHIGRLNDETLVALFDFIDDGEFMIEDIIDNL